MDSIVECISPKQSDILVIGEAKAAIKDWGYTFFLYYL